MFRSGFNTDGFPFGRFKDEVFFDITTLVFSLNDNGSNVVVESAYELTGCFQYYQVRIQKLKSVTDPNKELVLYAYHENPRWRSGSC
jgi:hypothetical protein